MADVGGLPLLTIAFDEDGDVDAAGEAGLRAGLDAADATDAVLFCHGWNNAPSTADRLYQAFFRPLPGLLAAHGRPDRKVVLVGVFWPSQRWSDEPIPDFEAGGVDLGAGGGGAAGFDAVSSFPAPPSPDAATREQAIAAFPEAERRAAAELFALLEQRPDDRAALDRARELVAVLARSPGTDPRPDGEHDGGVPAAGDPATGTDALFGAFAAELEATGVALDEDSGGGAGFGERLGRLWHGAQEVARQLTFWQMRRRAGVVGERGLGPLLGRLLTHRPGLALHLAGHSFGARVVSYALAGLPASAGPAPVAAVSLFQGAFSHFAFAGSLPFDPGRRGALHGVLGRVAGPVVACYSRHDHAVGVFYPLAMTGSPDDAAGLTDSSFRWGGIGRHGHQAGVTEIPLAKVGTRYAFAGPGPVNIDASPVTRTGRPPSGAHSDICHPELAWVVACAGGLV